MMKTIGVTFDGKLSYYNLQPDSYVVTDHFSKFMGAKVIDMKQEIKF
ncbi:hypothetical protein [Pedobacter chinensis]|nr:hypothetical protein [Pedobacter chinensis]